MQALRRVFGVQPSSEFHDHGLRLLIPDLSDTGELRGTPTTDIVFVHGLTGTWDGTWTGETADGRKVLWPKELLKERFPTARIFSFGYDANAVNLTHRVSTQSITQHANDLLIELENVRRETKTQECNIVFVVHSLGGLVVQKMLSLSKSSHESHYQCIESSTIGAVFFGTPMLGADLAAWASIGTALSSVLKQTNRDIVGVLEPDSSMAGSIRLDITNLVATRARTNNPIKIACFYECLPVHGYGKVVVNDRSATWPPHYHKGIQADHMSMTKFASTQARGYRDFVGEVGRWIDDDTGQRRQPSDFLDRLDFAERMARQQQIDDADALESTLEWFWNKNHESHSSFAHWLLDNQAMFWIQGKPGSGKSTLMSYVEKASRSWQSHSGSESPWSTIRFFFDFRAHNGLANNLEGFLRSLLLQILKQLPDSEDRFRRLEEKFGNGKADKWPRSTLKEAFTQAVVQTSTNLCILVDGLDEFSGNMLELLSFLHNLPSRTGTGHLLKICLASRPHPVIALALGDRPGLQMQTHNTNAIEQYACTTIGSMGVAAHDRSWLMQFSAVLAKKAEGVFLWARFAVTEVVNGYAIGEDFDELNQRLEALPSDMEELYADMFRRMNSRDREEARLMFQLVCFQQCYEFSDVKHINLRQLKEAVAISKNNVGDSAQHSPADELERFRKRLKAKSGGLLEEVFYESHFEDHYFDGSLGDQLAPKEHFRRNGGMITLIHRTAESYLDREGWFLGLESLQTRSPHGVWLHVCCRSIQSNLEPYESQLQHARPTKMKTERPTKSSLFGYASRGLFVHARLLEFEHQVSSFPFLKTLSPTLFRHLRKLCRSPALPDNGPRLYWEAVRDAADEAFEKQPWLIIVEQGLSLCLRDAALQKRYVPPSDGEDMSFALVCFREWWKYDVHEGERIVQQLFSHLIEFWAVVRQRHILECLYIGTAGILGTLLASWPEKMIRLRTDTFFPLDLLLSRFNSDLTYENQTYNGESVGVLWELVRVRNISFGDGKDMLNLLLNRGESLDEVCGPGGTALHGCIIKEHLSGGPERGEYPIREILDHGANPNVSGPQGTPLQLAWRMFRSLSRFKIFSHEKRPELQNAMRLLMNFGANPSWVEPNGLSIDRRTIEAWCAMSPDEMNARWEDDDYPYCLSDWSFYKFPLYRADASNVGWTMEFD